MKKEPIILNGKTYKSRAEVARAYGKSPQLVNYRINTLGMELKEAVEMPISDVPHNAVPDIIDGVEYRSFNEACRAHNRDAGTARARIVAGLDKESALKRNDPREIEIDGIIYPNPKNCCSSLKISYHAVMQYSKRHNISKKEAILHYKNKKCT